MTTSVVINALLSVFTYSPAYTVKIYMPVHDDGRMGKVDRFAAILRLLETTGLALPPTPIYVNLVRNYNYTFSKRTVDRYLSDLADKGYVDTLANKQGYYYITDAGRKWLDEFDSSG